MGDQVAFLLPFCMLTFGIAFLIVQRWGERSALCWAAGFTTGALAFSVSLCPLPMPVAARALLADALFALSFLLYGQALWGRFGGRCLGRLRIAVAIGSVACCAYALFGRHSLQAELVASDLGCAALICIPLAAAPWRLFRPVDRALLAVTLLVAGDTLARASTVALTTVGGGIDTFQTTQYAALMEGTAFVFGLLFALTALAAVTLDVLSDYRAEALTDPLSGLSNRRGFEAAVASHGRAHGSVVSCDIDHFKRVNDRHGHAAGDQVIMALARLIRAELPDRAMAARFGGEEFVIFLPSLDAAAASRFANRVRLAFSGENWAGLGIDLPLTASFGLSGTQRDDFSIHDAIGRADHGLYDAKNAGRNRVSVRLALVAPPLDRVAEPAG